MLLELVVENYAVVERLRVRFHPGLNLLTGETGSGKSIVVDALGLLLGGRASADMIRAGAGAGGVRTGGAPGEGAGAGGFRDQRRRASGRARDPGERQEPRVGEQPAS